VKCPDYGVVIRFFFFKLASLAFRACICVIQSNMSCARAYIYIYIYIYRVSQEECARFRDGVPYAKVYRYNPKHLCPKLNGYGDNGQ